MWIRQVSASVRSRGEETMRQWTDLRISFDIAHHTGGDPSKGKVTLYGLSADSRKWIKDNGHQLLVRAGYGAAMGDIFAGDVTRVEIQKDLSVQITAGDGEQALQDSTISLTLAPGTSLSDAITAITDQLGLNVGHLPDYEDVPFLAGCVLHGPVSVYLDWVARELGCQWWIQDGELIIQKPGYPLDELAMVVNIHTGLVGRPKGLTKKREQQDGEAEDTAVEDVWGVGWTQLLDPRMRPGRYVRLESQQFTGVYVPETVKFIGDSGWDDTFYCEVEAKEMRV